MSRFQHALIIDDSRLAREGLSGLLTAAGLKVTMAQTAESALTGMKTVKPDVIFMDSRMPDCNAFDVVRSLTTAPATATIPVVICASRDTPAEREKARQCGARGFLVKPLTARMVDKTLDFLQSESAEGRSAGDLGTVMPDWSKMPVLDASDEAGDLPILEIPAGKIPLLVPEVGTKSLHPPASDVGTKSSRPPASDSATASVSEVVSGAMSGAGSANVVSTGALPKGDSSSGATFVTAHQPQTEVHLAGILEKIHDSVQEIAYTTAQEVALQISTETSRSVAEEAGRKAGIRAGLEAGQKKGQQAGEEAGKQAGHQAGYQAGQQAGQQAGYQAGQQAGEKIARALIDSVLEDEFSQWKSSAKNDVYEQVRNKALPLVRKLANEIAEQIAREVATQVATETALARAEEVGRSVAGEVAQVTARSVASETAQSTAMEVMNHFSAQWRRKLIRYTLLISLLGAVIAGAVTILLQKYPLL